MGKIELMPNMPENFEAELSDTLLDIYESLNHIQRLSVETITPEKVDEIMRQLDSLGQEAEKQGNQATQEMLSKLCVHFYLLNTVGVIDDRDKFENQAVHAIQLLEMILLSIDGSVAKNKGRILTSFEQNK